jgi:hypothetical protein
MPTASDLVTDLPADFETFGQAVATSMADLLGGTTGQVLSKASNTDMDFTWVAADDTNAIQNAIVDAKGDLIAATANDTPARLAVGNNGETLVADSSATTGLRWQGDYAAGKNKIINGDMVIDQRSSASSPVSITGSSLYSVDRFRAFSTSPAVYSIGQDSSAPAGFSKSLKATITTIDSSVTGTDQAGIAQNIEGSNMSELQWGTASAKTITLSFWVRSSLTGTFGGGIRNIANTRSYPFSYTISVADTWEKKTITIAGETTGTWLYDSTSFCSVVWSLGAGTDRAGTAGAWNTNNNIGVTGQVQVVGTLNATFFLSGVQFEIGNVATAFQTATGTVQGELAACQRYYWRRTALQYLGAGHAKTATNGDFVIQYPVQMRIAPSLSTNSGSNYFAFDTAAGLGQANTIGNFFDVSTLTTLGRITSSGFTAGQGGVAQINNASGYLEASAEL